MKYKVLCDRFMDGDENVGGEINGMLCSIHELLSSVYDASPLILMSDGFHLTRIEVRGEFYLFDVSNGYRDGTIMIPIECIKSHHPQSAYAYWYLHRILLTRVPAMEEQIKRQQQEVAELKAEVNFALYRLQTSSWSDL